MSIELANKVRELRAEVQSLTARLETALQRIDRLEDLRNAEPDGADVEGFKVFARKKR